jgi:hypothetical protein
MFEQLKAALVTLLVIFIFFVGGILVGLKLPETAVYQKWSGTDQEPAAQTKPIQFTEIQAPGSQISETQVDISAVGPHPGNCAGGVCRLPVPGRTEPQTVETVPQTPALTFYQELADKPNESNGSALMVKPTPVVKKRKPAALLKEKPGVVATDSGGWEIRVCSLSQEIKARLERSKLMNDFPGVEIEPIQVAGKGTWYRIKIINIKERDVAERYQRELVHKYNYKPLLCRQ